MAKILIVDDSHDLLEFLSLLLTKHGHEVQTAKSKKDLHYQVPVFKPDLILLDVRLGGENGRELCKEIKENNPTLNVPVILLSASPELLIDHKECAANDVIEKPFDIHALVNKIESQLKVTI